MPVIERCLRRVGWSKEDLTAAVPHQTAKQVVELSRRALGAEKLVVHTTIEEWGNTGSNTMPGTLAKVAAEGALKDGERVLFSGVGSGISVGVVLMEW